MTGQLTILIVDDDEVDRFALKRLLGKASVEASVVEATTAGEARQALEGRHADCIFLDYLLPDSDGKSLLGEFRANGVDIPIIVLTGQGDERLAVELMQIGASDYLPKSALSPEVISRTLNNVMRIYAADVERRRAQEEQKALLEKLKEAQHQLLQSEKLASIGQLAAGVAHEINNPVGYINSNIASLAQYVNDVFVLIDAYERAEALLPDSDEKEALQILRDRLDLDFLKQDLQSLLRECQEGVNRVKQIVQDLKDFSHVNETEWQWADLHQGLDSTLNIVHNEIKYKADVVKEYGDLPQIECIGSQLNQVFMNLLVNAAQAIDGHGLITVRTGMDGEEKVWIEIQDTGKGIPPEDLKRIFEPFFTTKPVGKGTGLGLSVSYGIVKNHGGLFEVTSETGKGTSFRIRLPVKQSETRVEA